jgi:hypothetical protein
MIFDDDGILGYGVSQSDLAVGAVGRIVVRHETRVPVISESLHLSDYTIPHLARVALCFNDYSKSLGLEFSPPLSSLNSGYEFWSLRSRVSWHHHIHLVSEPPT